MWNTPKWKAYLVECSDNTLYCGITVDMDMRLKMHNKGKASKYTRSRLPVKLVWQMDCNNESHARKTERLIKSLTREQKESLIAGGKVWMQ